MVSQEAAIVGDVSYHEYRGLVLDPKERDDIAKNLGLHNKVLILRNHGMVTCGESLEEALYLMHNLVSACESQIKLLPIGMDNISIMTSEAIDQVRSVVKSAGTQVQGKPGEEVSSPTKGGDPSSVKKWKIWDLEFEAQMRMLDNAVRITITHSSSAMIIMITITLIHPPLCVWSQLLVLPIWHLTFPVLKFPALKID